LKKAEMMIVPPLVVAVAVDVADADAAARHLVKRHRALSDRLHPHVAPPATKMTTCLMMMRNSSTSTLKSPVLATI